MYEGTTPAPDSPIPPLRRHNLSKQFECSSCQRKEHPPSSRTIFPPATPSFPRQYPPETAYVTSADPSLLREMKFRDAGERWLEAQKAHLKERSFEMAGHHLKTLNKFFGETPLHEIHIGNLDKYQAARVRNTDGMWKKAAGPSIILHELRVMQQILKRAELWGPMAGLYVPMRMPVSTKKSPR